MAGRIKRQLITGSESYPRAKEGYTKECGHISFGWEGEGESKDDVQTTGFRINLREYDEENEPIYATILMDRATTIWLRDTIDKLLKEYPE